MQKAESQSEVRIANKTRSARLIAMNEYSRLANMRRLIKADPVPVLEVHKPVPKAECHGMTRIIKRGEGIGGIAKSNDDLVILPMDKVEDNKR